MIKIDNYLIEQYNNEIIIKLPQTIETATNTVSPVVNRKVKLSDEELAALLACTIKLFEGENK